VTLAKNGDCRQNGLSPNSATVAEIDDCRRLSPNPATIVARVDRAYRGRCTKLEDIKQRGEVVENSLPHWLRATDTNVADT